jgi:hypothetical protein
VSCIDMAHDIVESVTCGKRKTNRNKKKIQCPSKKFKTNENSRTRLTCDYQVGIWRILLRVMQILWLLPIEARRCKSTQRVASEPSTASVATPSSSPIPPILVAVTVASRTSASSCLLTSPFSFQRTRSSTLLYIPAVQVPISTCALSLRSPKSRHPTPQARTASKPAYQRRAQRAWTTGGVPRFRLSLLDLSTHGLLLIVHVHRIARSFHSPLTISHFS